MKNSLIKFNGKVDVFYDGQAGSCGKGKFVGTFARKSKVDIAINQNMPNAGHSFVFNNGRRVVTTHLPIAVVSPNVKYLVVGPDAIIDPEILKKEIKIYSDLIGNRKIYIHQNAGIVKPKHKEIEIALLRNGSTFKGAGAARCDKILRAKGCHANEFNFGEIQNKIEIIDNSFFLNLLTATGEFNQNTNILCEMSQGFDLDIDFGIDQQHVTSRPCDPAYFMSRIGLAPLLYGNKVKKHMIIRPYPIRISNDTNLGEISSGDYAGSRELAWQEIANRCFAKQNLEMLEKTTITKKIRRVFEFNDTRLKSAICHTMPNDIILNFAQYINYYGKDLNNNNLIKSYNIWNGKVFNEEMFIKASNEMSAFCEIAQIAQILEEKYKTNVSLIGTGEKEDSYINYNKVPNEIKYAHYNAPFICHSIDNVKNALERT
ncbi:MAG: adenylosuccinate synthetase [Clostridia bacterium]|nr:adenylosuccinate synthetase [Clostridia bacterium]MDD4685900.1 adenylosuccinate synthetase [Clostridia bacterium]